MFTGFTEDTFQFFDAIAANNNRDWWLAHKAHYETSVKQPILDLTSELALRYSEAHIFRPNRDTRFTKDKGPYKTSISFSIPDGKCEFYFQLDTSGILLGGGLYEPGKQQLQEWREIFDTNRADDVKQFMTKASHDGFKATRDGALKTAPQGWPKDHPDVEYLRLKHIAMFKQFLKDSWMLKPESFDTILQGFELVHEWNLILNRLIVSDASN